ncbi:hypothetical protein BGX27_006774, partial [Mortierella sp. AM989]
MRKIKLPKSNKITANQINDISLTRGTGKRREKQLRKDDGVQARSALQQLSDAGRNIQGALTLNEIEDAQKERRNTRKTLREFENSPTRVKDRRTLRLRTERSWRKLGGAERRYIQQHGEKDHL